MNILTCPECEHDDLFLYKNLDDDKDYLFCPGCNYNTSVEEWRNNLGGCG